MVAHQTMVNHVSTNTAIAANVVVENGAVNTDSVPDDDIQYVVNQAWDAVALSAF
jgi:NACalpha-BTF3-like transcription factor